MGAWRPLRGRGAGGFQPGLPSRAPPRAGCVLTLAFPFPQSLTKDLGGSAKCSDFTEEICRRVKDFD